MSRLARRLQWHETKDSPFTYWFGGVDSDNLFSVSSPGLKHPFDAHCTFRGYQFLGGFHTLEEAKQAAQDSFEAFVNQCVL